jgi:hypothetical protein
MGILTNYLSTDHIGKYELTTNLLASVMVILKSCDTASSQLIASRCVSVVICRVSAVSFVEDSSLLSL